MCKQKTCQSAKLLQEICRNFARNFFAKFLKKRLENFFGCAYNPTCQKRDGFAFDGKRLLGMNRDLKTMTNELQRLSQESGYSLDELLERVPNGFAVRTKKSRVEVDYIIKHDYTLHFFRIREFMECDDVSKQFNIVFIEGDGDLVLADIVYANIMIKGKW